MRRVLSLTISVITLMEAGMEVEVMDMMEVVEVLEERWGAGAVPPRLRTI